MVYPHMYRTEKSETRTTNATYGDYYQQQQSKKIPIQPSLLKMFRYVDSRRPKFINNLTEFVAIKSISDDINYKPEVVKLIKNTEKWLDRLNFKFECFNIGSRMVDDKKVKLLPVILASLTSRTRKKTVYNLINKKNLIKIFCKRKTNSSFAFMDI